MFKKIFIVAAMVLSTAAYAQETKDSAATTDSKEYSETGDLLCTAGKLIKYGYKTKTALPLIQAIEIYKRLGVHPATEAPQKTDISDELVESPSQESSPVSFKIEQLIADAIIFADGDKNILALISSMGETRGAVDGPASFEDTIERAHTHLYEIEFRGGEQAVIYVNGNGNTDLDLYVYDRWDNYIAKDTNGSDNCVVYFTPKRTDKYVVKLVNRGRYSNHYIMVTNYCVFSLLWGM